MTAFWVTVAWLALQLPIGILVGKALGELSDEG